MTSEFCGKSITEIIVTIKKPCVGKISLRTAFSNYMGLDRKMIKFITGRSGSGKSCMIADSVAELIEKTDKSAVVIVPEQETVVWESRLASRLPASANLRLEVTNFTRLANSVFREYGGLADSVIDDGSRILIMWRAMISVWEGMKVYNNITSREERSIPILMRAVDELKGSGITPEAAEEALNKLIKNECLINEQNGKKNVQIDDETAGDKSSRSVSVGLSDRLHDAVLVYAAYDALLHEDYIDKEDLEIKLADSLSKNPFFVGKTVFIDSFLSFTKGQERVIREIIRSADEVYMTFMTPYAPVKKTHDKTKIDISGGENLLNESEDFFGEDEIQFYETTAELKKMMSLCSKLDKEYEIIILGENLRHRGNPQLELIERYLFDYSRKPEKSTEHAENDAENVQNVQIIRCRDKYEEAEACSAIIAKLLSDGYENRDIAIVARDIAKYDGIVDSELRRHGQDCFISQSNGVLLNPVIRFVESALCVIANGWRREDIICLLKTGVVSVNVDGEDELEKFSAEIFAQYITVWDINSRRMYTGDDWSMNPAGYKIGISDYGERILKIVNQTKNRIAQPLQKLAEIFDNSDNDVKHGANVRQIAESLVQYAQDIGVPQELKKIVGRYKSIGMASEAEKCGSGWRIMCEILDKIVDILSDTSLDAGRFLGLFHKVAAALDVGSIPSGMNEIIIGSAQGIRLDDKKCIIMLGSNDGEFPGTPSADKTFFAEKDKISLEMCGINLSDKDETIFSAREYCVYYRAVASAGDKAYILVDENEEISEGARRILNLCQSKIKDFKINDFRELDVKELVYDVRSAENYLLSNRYNNINEIIEKATNNTHNVAVLNENDDKTGDIRIEMPESGKTLILSQTKIDTYVKCPFNYACRYELGIKSRPVSDMTLPDVGIIVHRILQEFFEKNTQNGKIDIADDRKKIDDEVDRIIDSIKSEYIESVGSIEHRYEYLFIRIKKHIILFIKKITSEMLESDFKPVSFERKIGKNGIPPIKFKTENQNEIILEGIADRIDLFKDENGDLYVRVIDFKTGNRSFSLEKIDKGAGIQLLIYLFSLVKNGSLYISGGLELKAGGGLYIANNLSSVNVRPDATSEEIENEAMDNIKVSGIMNERFAGNVKNKNIVYKDKSGFVLIYDELEKAIRKIGDEIINRNFSVSPQMIDKSMPCDWCENEYICRNKR